MQLFKKENQGSTLYTFESESYEIVWYSSDHDEEKILAFCEELHDNFEKALEKAYNVLGGIFEIFIRNTKVINFLF